MADLKMPELNYVLLAGNLTKDPVFRTTSNNTPVVNFSIASNRRYRDRNNLWQEDVCYVGIVAWNKLAESCSERLRKGSAVLVEGELQTRAWKAEDGNHRSVLEVKARRIQFLNKNYKTNGSTSASEDFDDASSFHDEEGFEFFEDDTTFFPSAMDSEHLPTNKTSK